VVKEEGRISREGRNMRGVEMGKQGREKVRKWKIDWEGKRRERNGVRRERRRKKRVKSKKKKKEKMRNRKKKKER
jgi:hypothetical protein